MDYLPPKEPVGTSALRALFESKVTLRQDCSSSPRLNVALSASNREKQCLPVVKRAHSTVGTPVKKDNPPQRVVQAERRRQTSTGVPESCIRGSANSQDDKRHPKLTHAETPSRPDRERRSTSASVRDRSALYLSKVAAADSTGESSHPEFTSSSEKKTKLSKMADVAKQIRVSEASHEEHDLSFPPPPPVPPRPLNYEESANSSPLLPVPPPKETFSTFYQQRQKNELKRLFKHIHPDLKGKLNDVVDDELVEALQSEISAEDTGYQGEVQSMRWIFENWTLDNIGDPHTTKKLLEEENLQGGDVRGTSSMFEHCEMDDTQHSSRAFAERQVSVRGDVRTSTWLFETKPLDILNELNQEKGEMVEAVLKEPIQGGDVRGARLLFESKPLDALGHCCSVENQNFLKLKSELQEQKGDVQKTVKLFQADPCCAIRDNSGNIHEIKSICREEINSSNISTARWLFETQPLDVIRKDTSAVKIIQGISLEEGQRGGVDRKRWMFETQPFLNTQEGIEENKFQGTVDDFVGEADVENKRKLFETQPLATLKGECTSTNQEKEEILGGNVKTSLWLFETQPMDTLKDSYEIGHLKEVSLAADEQGEVKGKKQQFENYNVRKETSVRELEIEKGDVKSFKHLFETIPLGDITQSEEVMNGKSEKDITAGNVNGNKELFESTPLYAIKDSSGNFHEVTTVSREESIKGNVQNCKWMFETKPLDQFQEGKGSMEVIKGITRQEDVTGDVKMAKWLFETQTLDCIHSKFNLEAQNPLVQQDEFQKGDVKTCKWFFETQPMDILSDKSNKLQDKEAIENANVKSFTWLFESQPLDSIKAGDEHSLKLCSTIQDGVKAEAGVKTVKHLFETETLDKIRKDTDTEQDVRYVSQINVQSGDVSRVKEIFESQSLDEIGTEAESMSDREGQDEDIQKGSVHKFTWLFENRPINTITEKKLNGTSMYSVSEDEAGDVHNKKFIFETFSLDKIQEKPLEDSSASLDECESSVDVKSSTMLFESQPLYAIRDKEGQFHEVTTVKKEEVMSGDVRGARWMFETKPLDSIQAEQDIYVIRAVTQEDVLKGDVKSARWKFETQPLDTLTCREEPSVKVVEEFGKHNVQLNKQLFESEQSAHKKYVRMVSVTDVQQGDVRTSTWLFENQPIDSLKGGAEEQGPVKTVHREDNQKGEVKRCTWLFESQPLDKLKEVDATSAHAVEENIPKADVKSTTWMFETTPLDKITVGSVADSLTRLSELQVIHSSGIVIEANEISNVNMAKYQLISKENIEILKEERVEGNIRNIMLQLLCKPTMEPRITLLREGEQGNVNTTVLELPVNQPSSTVNLDGDQRMQSIAKMIESLLVENKIMKTGIVMQESARGQAEMTVYSLFCHTETRAESQDITRGDVKSTIGNLLATANSQRTSVSCRLDENEKGNVNLYKNCIEKGDLQYLKSLQSEPEESDVLDLGAKEQIEILQGDVKEAKRILCQKKQQVERTISDVLPGDVKNAKKVFSSEGSIDLGIEHCVPKENIIRGDISSAKQQLGQAVKQPITVEKEEIVAGDIKATLQSLERAKKQSLNVEREVIKPGTIYDIDLSAQGPEPEDNDSLNFKEEIVSGDVKAAKQSLELAKNQSMRVEREIVVPGKIYNVNVSSQEQSSTTTTQSTSSCTSRGQRITTTFRKVSDTETKKGIHEGIEACPKGAVSKSADVVNICVSEDASQQTNTIPSQSCVKSEYQVENTDEETEAEVLRGDVKAAIKSLQNAATEQRLLDKEDVIRGNMQLALQSLERSSVNVSKGDFKTAMIYRNSGKAYSGPSKKVDSETVHKQGVVVSMPPSDTELSPSVSVTYGEPPAITTLNSDPVTLTHKTENTPSEDQRPPPLPPKTSDKLQEHKKPALPPKPQRSKLSSDTAQNIHSLSKAPGPVKVKSQNPVIPPKTKLEKSSSPSTPRETSANKREHRQDLPQNDRSREISILKTTKGEKQGSPQSISNNDTQVSQDSNTLNSDRNVHRKALEDIVEPPLCETNTDKNPTIANSNECVMDKNEIQKINAAEEIRMCMQSYANDSCTKTEIHMGFQVALQNFGGKDKNTVDSVPVSAKKIQAVKETVSQVKNQSKSTMQQVTQHSNAGQPESASAIIAKRSPSIQNSRVGEEQVKAVDKVVLRKKKAKKETEGERRQRLSVHKDEIMKGNVTAAMEIFENLRKREELKTILSQVQEIEGETSTVDVGSLKTLFENVPAWIVTPRRTETQSHSKREKKVEKESLNTEMESASVEAAFVDLEKASHEIMNLKEQTLAKLIDIEEAIRKALYSVSNLKSEADIAGLSGLFNESLNSEQSCQDTQNNIRKISIVSSKTKTEKVKPTPEAKMKGCSGLAKTLEEAPAQVLNMPPVKQCMSSPSSPSFISIHSAARKHPEQSKSPKSSTFKTKAKECPQSCNGVNADVGQPTSSQTSNQFSCPVSPRRNVSVLQVQTVPEAPAGLVGTKTVSEKYEETDCFGNKFVSSKTSTFVTKQSETKTAPLFEVVSCPTRYEVMASPLIRRSGHTFTESAQSSVKEGGTVFVTFGQQKAGKK
ncbi:xin actin-binding repeat-containing protein 1 isoform X3 [Osmerus eperlanus]|uniref:xin actin-binding repeat-containing protein 1 isoform X3 n=3 Tax=Osmerus eperlanus TaxID=29151 RepID=UPI002E11511D